MHVQITDEKRLNAELKKLRKRLRMLKTPAAVASANLWGAYGKQRIYFNNVLARDDVKCFLDKLEDGHIMFRYDCHHTQVDDELTAEAYHALLKQLGFKCDYADVKFDDLAEAMEKVGCKVTLKLEAPDVSEDILFLEKQIKWCEETLTKQEG